MATSKTADHISLEGLLDLVEGGRSSTATMSHIDACAACAQSLAEAKAIRASLLLSGDLSDPPSAVLARAVDLLPRRPSLLERAATRVREVLLEATDAMLAPSCGKLAFAGVRGHLDPTHYRFVAQGVEVDLEVAAERLTGQMVAENQALPPITAWIEPSEGHGVVPGSETPVGRDGMFHMAVSISAPFDVVIDRGEERLRVRVAPRAT